MNLDGMTLREFLRSLPMHPVDIDYVAGAVQERHASWPEFVCNALIEEAHR